MSARGVGTYTTTAGHIENIIASAAHSLADGIKITILGDNPSGDNSPGDNPPTENTPRDTPRSDSGSWP